MHIEFSSAAGTAHPAALHAITLDKLMRK